MLTDTFIQKTKKLYQDTRTQRNISKLNDELYEVHQIMTRNVQEVLGVGEKLDRKIIFHISPWDATFLYPQLYLLFIYNMNKSLSQIFAEVSKMSSRLTSESRIYADNARDLNRQVSFICLVNNMHWV